MKRLHFSARRTLLVGPEFAGATQFAFAKTLEEAKAVRSGSDTHFPADPASHKGCPFWKG